MIPSRPLSLATVTVLKAIADGTHYGFDIMDVTGLPSGTVYPILGRLEKLGLVRSHWESPAAAQKAKRPPRRNYEASAAGLKALAASIEHYRTLGGMLAPTALTPRTRHS